MSTTATRREPAKSSATGPQPADVLVVFGITGDLAKVMTFRSLYRLERRGLLDCPIVGVAVERLDGRPPPRARPRLDRGHRRAGRPEGVRPLRRPALVRRRATSATRRRTTGSATRSRAPSSRSFYLEIPPFLFGTVVKGLREAGLTKTARVVVEKPFGHDLESARALAAELHQYVDESQLYRIDHFLGKMGLEELLYLRFANTMLEPVWNRNYVECVADHDGRELRRRGPRPLLRSGRRAARRRRQPPHAGGRGAAMEAPAGGDPDTLQDAKLALFRSIAAADPGPLRARPVRRLPRDRRCRRRTRPPRRIAALRLDIDNWRWSRRAVLHPHRQAPAAHADRGAARLQAPAAARLRQLIGGRQPEPDQLVVKLDPSTGVRFVARRPPRGRRAGRRRSRSTWSSPTRAARAPTPYEVLLHAAMVGRQQPVHPPGRRRGDLADHAAAARRAAAGAPVRTGHRGARPRPTSWSPATAAGTSPGWRHERDPGIRREAQGGREAQGRRAAPAAERGRAVAVPADRRVRVPLQLPHRRAGRARRRGRLAVRARLRLAERVRQPARPPGGVLPVRPVRHQPSDGAHLRAGDERPRHDLEDALRMGGRARRPDDGPVAPRGRGDAAHAAAGRRRRRPHARAHGRVPRGQRRGGARLRAGLRLRPRAGGVDARRRRPARRRCAPAPGRRSGSAPTSRSASRATASAPATSCAAGDRAYCALSWAEGLDGAGRRRGGRGADRGHDPVLARVARPRPHPRPPLPRPDPALGARDQGPDVHADRGDGGGAHHVAAGDAGRRAQLGLPLHLDARHDVHAAGAALAATSTGRPTSSCSSSPTSSRPRTARCRSCTASTAGGT